NFHLGSVCQKKRILTIIYDPHVLAFFPIVANQPYCVRSLRNERETGHCVKASAVDNPAVLHREIERAYFLSTFVKDIVYPTIADFERQKICRHSNTGLSEER